MLQLMRRNITRQETVDLIRRFREEVPGIHLRTTMMRSRVRPRRISRICRLRTGDPLRAVGSVPYSHEDTYNDKHYSDDVPAEVKQNGWKAHGAAGGNRLTVNEAKVANNEGDHRPRRS